MNDLYKIQDGSTWHVHAGSHVLPVKNQRGKLYVNFKGKQINLKDIPDQQIELYPIHFGYVFLGGHQHRDIPEFNNL